MPPINHYKCNKCKFTLPSGWGGYMYVEDQKKRRVVCPHPCEQQTVLRVLGGDASEEVIKKRTGFNSDCVCLDCLNQFEADFSDENGNPWRAPYWTKRKKDERICPKCGSDNVNTIWELIGSKCPKCKKGIIVEINTEIMC